MKSPKNASLIVGLSIPILMIVFVAASIYVPRFFAHPQYDFAYQQQDYNQYDCKWTYTVTGQKLTRTEQTKQFPEQVLRECDVSFYVHDVEKNESSEVTFEALQAMKLDERPFSPDGFEVAQGRSGESFPFFFGSYSYEIFLRRGVVSKKMAINGRNQDYYSTNFQLIGWILP